MVALDKGTLDAISLNPEGQVQAIEKYSKNVASMLCKNKTSYLLITRFLSIMLTIFTCFDYM